VSHEPHLRPSRRTAHLIVTHNSPAARSVPGVRS
jgi:hypothetical protein